MFTHETEKRARILNEQQEAARLSEMASTTDKWSVDEGRILAEIGIERLTAAGVISDIALPGMWDFRQRWDRLTPAERNCLVRAGHPDGEVVRVLLELAGKTTLAEQRAKQLTAGDVAAARRAVGI